MRGENSHPVYYEVRFTDSGIYVVFSIAILLIYSAIELIISTNSGISHDTLTTCFYSVFGDYYDNIDNEGHIFIKITNDTKNDRTITIKKGDAFAQGIILPFETAYEDEITIERVGGIGSTSKN